MAKTVFCRKYQKNLPALSRPPLPGTAGQALMETVSQQAWDEWVKLQTMLINEHRLSLMEPEARQWLSAQRDLFFENADYAKPEGYVPPKG
jgi:Fe-S cluster biosynthesis and repair protein YggX